MSGVRKVNTDTFQEEVKTGIVVVDFYADWCGPFKVVAPIMERLATEYDGRVQFTKLDVYYNAVIADQFGIMSIPTLIVFKSGNPVERFVGAAPAENYRSIIERVLA